MATSMLELDSVEIQVIIDNELDPISTYQHPDLKVGGQMPDIAMKKPLDPTSRGGAVLELDLENICCGAHGLSLLVTGYKGESKRTILFDTGPEPRAFEQNSSRLRADLASVEHLQLSHWHKDHSGGMLKALSLINNAKSKSPSAPQGPVTVDLHPSRPAFRGFNAPTGAVISLEADPTFEEIEAAGGKVAKNDQPHTVLDGMFLISGEIPRVTPYEQGVLRGLRYDPDQKQWIKDELIRDERFLMCKVKDKGIVVFTGCSHAGVVNASRHAMELAGTDQPLLAVIGGYHLVGPNEAMIKDTIADLQKLDPKILMPGHCSGWRAKVEIERLMPGRLAPCTVGTKFTL